jgi:hypothetical protein
MLVLFLTIVPSRQETKVRQKIRITPIAARSRHSKVTAPISVHSLTFTLTLTLSRAHSLSLFFFHRYPDYFSKLLPLVSPALMRHLSHIPTPFLESPSAATWPHLPITRIAESKMAADKEFFLAAFETIFRNLNPAQRSTFSESLAAACVAAPREITADDMGLEATGNVIDQRAEPEPNPPAKTISRTHKRRESAAGNKRVVNGFICFRCKSLSLEPSCLSQCTNMYVSFLLCSLSRPGSEIQVWTPSSDVVHGVSP